MGFQVSPGIVTNEIDLTTIVPLVSTTIGAFAGVFRWGPLDKLISVDSRPNLAARLGAPSNFNGETWYTASNFLDYGDQLLVSRAGDWTGNTVQKAFSGNSTNLAIQANTNVLQLANTTGLIVGMQLFYSNNTGLLDSTVTTLAPTITSVVNSTAVVLSENATSNVQSISAVFRENIVYTAIAQEIVTQNIDWDGQIVRNEDEYAHLDGLFDAETLYVARYAGSKGNSLRLSVCDTAAQFHSNTDLTTNANINSTASLMAAVVGSNTLTVTIAPVSTTNATNVGAANSIAADVKASLAVNDLIEVGNTRLGFQYLKITSVGAVTNTANVYSFTISTDDEVKLGANVNHTTVNRYWEFYNLVDRAPGTSDYVTAYGNSAATDELHVIVVDENGEFGSPGTVLEVFSSLSRATDAKTIDNSGNYYKNVINQGSQYIWYANDRSTATSAPAQFITSSSATAPLNIQLYGGSDGLDESNVPVSTLTFAYDKFASPEEADISLIMQGKARGESVSYYTQLGSYIINNICENRKDVVAFISPYKEGVVKNVGNEAFAIVNARNAMPSSSYGVMDSGYKYQYDQYNDVFRWIPLNGDIAGLCVRTDTTNDAWWSPAGYKRGQIKNVTRLAYNPRKADRNTLYKSGVNPVITEPGAGTILLGDKTMLDQDSAFNRINVRRLFIVLRKAISRSAKSTLFEFNDDFTRSAFRAMVIPFLKDVQGRRGITDFFVKCDSENNTAQIRQTEQFVGDIYIKPNHAINFVNLNFIAVRDDVAFSEVIGKF